MDGPPIGSGPDAQGTLRGVEAPAPSASPRPPERPPAPTGRSLTARRLERSLVAAGVALLVLAGGLRVVGEVGKGRSLGRFEAARRAAGGDAPEAGGAPDTRLWSEERIRAWEESLRRELGAPLAVLSVPGVGIEVPVLEGTDELTLNRGAGHVEGTARPGETGNSGIAAHRDGFFRGLKDVAVGDAVELRTLTARHEFVVESIRIVSPEDVWVLEPTTAPVLTLVTCYPFYFVGNAPQRYIVRAVPLDGASGRATRPTHP